MFNPIRFYLNMNGSKTVAYHFGCCNPLATDWHGVQWAVQCVLLIAPIARELCPRAADRRHPAVRCR